MGSLAANAQMMNMLLMASGMFPMGKLAKILINSLVKHHPHKKYVAG